MKKGIFVLISAFMITGSFAQSEKYIKTMEQKVVAIDTTHDINNLKDLANTFERIGDAEKNQWLPYYYAALAHVNTGTMIAAAGGDPLAGGNAAKTDPEADKAEELLNKALALGKDNSETWVVKKQIASLRMMGDPMNRYMTYGPAAAEALANAKKLNPDNPRVYLLEGIDKFYTPEQYGGSKVEAQKLFEQAKKKFETFKPESSIHPTWGMGQVQYFMSQPK